MNADEMFEKLGFIKLEEIKSKEYRTIVYQNVQGKHINFGINHRLWIDGKYSFLTMQELQAINQKCKELGWL